jgi:hypothetical protein
MRIKFVLPMLVLTVAAITMSINAAEAANVDVQINGYLPAPPGVLVRVDAGRPYYVERDRRVYMEKEKPRHHKKHKKHHDDEGYKYGHDKHEGHEGGHEGGHGGGRGH